MHPIMKFCDRKKDDRKKHYFEVERYDFLELDKLSLSKTQ